MAKVINQDLQLTVRTNRRDRDRLHALAKSHNMKLSNFLRVLPDMYPPKTEAA
jgi:hypothetical protein